METNIPNKYEKSSNNKYIVLNFEKIIGNHKKHTINNVDINDEKYTADFLIEIKQGFISAGTNKEIIIYNKSYEKKTIEIEENSFKLLFFIFKINT